MKTDKMKEKTVERSEEYEAEYRISDGKAEFIKYLGNKGEYTVPEEFDGCPVVRVGNYAFSEHRNLDCVHLPSDLHEIGAHAFYNCRELKKLCFYDRIREMEDGAFKNCKKLSHLILYTESENRLVIKNILMDTTEGVRVTIFFRDGEKTERAELIFPPYLIEYEENTPARICEKQAHGSGERYRHCLYDGQLNFDQYDGLLDFSIAEDDFSYPAETAAARLMYPYRLKKESEVMYEQFFQKEIRRILEYYIRKEDRTVLRWMLEEKKLTEEEMNFASDLCRTYQKNGLLPMLMEYQRENFKPKQKTFEL